MTEILEPLEDIARFMLDLDCAEESSKYEFDDEDLMNAIHIFWTVIGNIQAVRALKAGKGLKIGSQEGQAMGQELRDLIFKYTGLDTQKYYHQ